MSRHAPRLAASMSLTERELLALKALLDTARRGGDVRQIAKSPECVGVARKVAVGIETVERNRAQRYERTERPLHSLTVVAHDGTVAR